MEVNETTHTTHNHRLRAPHIPHLLENHKATKLIISAHHNNTDTIIYSHIIIHSEASMTVLIGTKCSIIITITITKTNYITR